MDSFITSDEANRIVVEQAIDSNYFVDIDKMIRYACAKGINKICIDLPRTEHIDSEHMSYRVSKRLPYILQQYFAQKGFNVVTATANSFILEW